MESKPAQVVRETTAACERCGSFEVLEIAGHFLCADCVAIAGCGCGDRGGDEE